MKPIDLIPASACANARKWAATQTGTPEQAWNACPRGDWLLWLAHYFGVERRLLVLSASDCAASVVDLVKSESPLASVWAIDSARRFARGETDVEECRAAADAAACAADAADASAAYVAYASAAYAAAYAAYAADAASAADAAYAAAAAAACAAYTTADAYTTAADAARKKKHAECARLVRKHIPWAVIEAAIAKGKP